MTAVAVNGALEAEVLPHLAIGHLGTHPVVGAKLVYLLLAVGGYGIVTEYYIRIFNKIVFGVVVTLICHDSCRCMLGRGRVLYLYATLLVSREALAVSIMEDDLQVGIGHEVIVKVVPSLTIDSLKGGYLVSSAPVSVYLGIASLVVCIEIHL